jgi:hypothetical protein
MRRFFIHFGLGAALVGLLWCVYSNHQQLELLRASQQELLARLNPSPAADSPAAQPVSVASSPVSSELLQLRGAMTRLTAQRRELATARLENERLTAQVAARTAATLAPRPGFIEKSKAQFIGYNSSEDTVQSMIWALQHHDLANFLQAFTPDGAESFMTLFPSKDGGQKLFENWDQDKKSEGISILSRTQMPDGSIELSIERSPGGDRPSGDPEKSRFYLINGQWKMGTPSK